MAETGFHVTLIAYFIGMLRAFFRHRPDVYVGGNMFIYYEEGETTRRLAPDIFVAFGVPNHERRSWLVWQEGKAPDVVFEFTSRSTRAEDQGSKKGLYEWLAIKEYFLFDPLGDYLRPRLQGFRLENDLFQPIPLVADQLESHTLSLKMHPSGNLLDLFDAESGERLLPPVELATALEAMEAQSQEFQQQLHQETTARRAADAEIARLQAELARIRGEA